MYTQEAYTMASKDLKKCWKGEVSNVLLALAVTLIAYFSFNYFKPGVEDMLAAIVFILVLILLKHK